MLFHSLTHVLESSTGSLGGIRTASFYLTDFELFFSLLALLQSEKCGTGSEAHVGLKCWLFVRIWRTLHEAQQEGLRWGYGFMNLAAHAPVINSLRVL